MTKNKALYNPEIDLLVEEFKSKSKQSWIKFAINKHGNKRLLKDAYSNPVSIYQILNSFIIENFHFNSLEGDKWFKTNREETRGAVSPFLSFDLHGYEYWSDKNAGKLTDLFLEEFSENGIFFLNSEPLLIHARSYRADPRDPVAENGVVAIDEKKIGGIWVSIHNDPHTLVVPKGFMDEFRNKKDKKKTGS